MTIATMSDDGTSLRKVVDRQLILLTTQTHLHVGSAVPEHPPQPRTYKVQQLFIVIEVWCSVFVFRRVYQRVVDRVGCHGDRGRRHQLARTVGVAHRGNDYRRCELRYVGAAGWWQKDDVSHGRHERRGAVSWN